jgi:hypothetical protein
VSEPNKVFEMLKNLELNKEIKERPGIEPLASQAKKHI